MSYGVALFSYDVMWCNSDSTKNETLGSWMTWGPCSQSCGTLGEQKRFRQCSNQQCSSTNQQFEVRVCNYAKKCPDTISNIFGKYYYFSLICLMSIPFFQIIISNLYKFWLSFSSCAVKGHFFELFAWSDFVLVAV